MNKSAKKQKDEKSIIDPAEVLRRLLTAPPKPFTPKAKKPAKK